MFSKTITFIVFTCVFILKTKLLILAIAEKGWKVRFLLSPCWGDSLFVQVSGLQTVALC